MLIVLVPLCLVAMFAALWCARPVWERSAGLVVLRVLLLSGAAIVLSTEAMSLMGVLTAGGAGAVWAMMLAAAAGAATWGHIRHPGELAKLARGARDWRGLSTHEARASLVCLLIVGGVCLAVAVMVPPNNWDSMTYHLPRVMHWIQNGSVEHYATYDMRRLNMPPASSYAILHVMLLSGSDHYVNLVQWVAWVGLVVAAGQVARGMGLGREGAVVAAALCGVFPMALVQSTTTQSDLFTACWVMCLAALVVRRRDYSGSDLLWMGLAFGLAVASKPTGILFGVGWLGYLVVRVGMRAGHHEKRVMCWARGVLFAVVVGLVAMLPSAAHFQRNHETFGSVMGADFDTRAEAFGPRMTLSSLSRNLALNMPVQAVWDGVTWFHDRVLRTGIDIPALTEKHSFQLPLSSTRGSLLFASEDFVGAPAHMVAAMLAAAWLAWRCVRGDRRVAVAGWLIPVMLLGLVLFSTLIKWQQWANRLTLPLLVFSGLLIAVFLRRCCPPAARVALVVLMGGLGVFYSLTQTHRPIIALPMSWTDRSQSPSVLGLDRDEMYFIGYGRFVEKPVADLIQKIAANPSVNRVGFSMPLDSWEYPFWVLIPKLGARPIWFSSVMVANESAKWPQEIPDDKIDAVIVKDARGWRYLLPPGHAATPTSPPPVAPIVR